MNGNKHTLWTTLTAFLLGASLLQAEQTPSLPSPAGDSWAFQYRENDFRDSALLDLRGLNEKAAGEHGFIRLDADGSGFVRGDGAPIRFWGVIKDSASSYTPAQWTENARWLSKMGVNMVRMQARLGSQEPGSQPGDVDQANIDTVWRGVAAMKKEGIYTSIINYGALVAWGKVDMGKWGIPGYEANYAKDTKAAKPWCVVYFNPQLQKIYKEWMKKLFTQVNPYTGISLAKDPAVLMIQLVTEDSLLFYTISGLQPEQQVELGRQYGNWLKIKYGSLDKALAVWNNEAVVQSKYVLGADDAGHGVMGFYNIWDATQAASRPSPGKAKRLTDQVEFLSRTMYNFNAEMARYMREELGCKQLILCGNWRPADPMSMQDAERWSYLPGQVMAENHFFGSMGGDGWHTVEGDLLNAPTALKPLALDDPASFVFKQVAGHATFITSTGWVCPNIHQSEAPFLLAAYGALAGLGGVCWDGFGGEPEYDKTVILKINPTTRWLLTWNNARPPFVSTFPAAALMYRNGYVKRGDTVVDEQRKLTDIWERKLPLAMDHGGYPATTAAMKDGAVDPLAFYVGPIRVKYDGDPAQSKVSDLSHYIHRDRQLVRSNTGQLDLDYGKGICTLDTPKAQGVCGFLDQTGKITLSTVTITSSNSYAAILVVPLDDQPLARSKKVLVQVGTTARPTGWKTEPAEYKTPNQVKSIPCERVLFLGAAPFQVASTHATLMIANHSLAKATLLDTNGMALRDVPITRKKGGCQLELPAEAMYVVISGE